MSAEELDRLQVIQRVDEKRLSQREAAQILGRSPRSVRRWLAAYRVDGAGAMASKLRGRPSNHRLPAGLRQRALELLREKYADFGPTFANEKLAELHDVHVSVETLRKWMVDDGLWVTRAKRTRTYQPRNRRSCFGELVQIDGCLHHWFEDRGPRCSLLVFVDDATGQLLELRMVESESTFSYFEATRHYVQRWGRPVAFYTDKHSVFRSNKRNDPSAGRATQFGRALTELNIDLICANTPQAKGRVERAHLTLQDRLVKELRLREISTIEAANEFLPEFRAAYNARFGKPAASSHDAHRRLRPSDDLDVVFTHREERKLSKNLTFQYERNLFLIETAPGTVWLPGQRVAVCRAPDGVITVRFGDVELEYRVLNTAPERPGRVLPNKRLDAALAHTRTLQAASDERSAPRPARPRRERIRERARLATIERPR